MGNLNYYVMSNYKLWGDVVLHNWMEIRTWNRLGIEQTKDSQSLDCGEDLKEDVRTLSEVQKKQWKKTIRDDGLNDSKLSIFIIIIIIIIIIIVLDLLLLSLLI